MHLPAPKLVMRAHNFEQEIVSLPQDVKDVASKLLPANYQLVEMVNSSMSSSLSRQHFMVIFTILIFIEISLQDLL